MPLKILVIGAGLVGAALAFRLAQGGAEVVVIDRAPPGSGASAQSFGWINANQPATAAYFALRHAAMGAWRCLGAEVPGLGLEARGTITWNDGDWTPEAELAALTRHGAYAAEILDHADLRALEPGIAGLPARAVLTGDETAADARIAAERLVAAAADLGAKFLIGPRVQALVEARGGFGGVHTDFGTFRADATVLATGIATGALLATAGFDLPMDNRPGFILHSRPVAPVLSHVVLAPDVHLRQEPDGRLVAGEVFFGEGPNAGEITRDPLGFGERLLAAMRARLPGVQIEPLAARLGTRPMPADGYPALGEIAPGLWVASTHSGVTLAPQIALSLAAEILRGRSDPLLAPYRPGRFAPAA